MGTLKPYFHHEKDKGKANAFYLSEVERMRRIHTNKKPCITKVDDGYQILYWRH